MMIMMMMMMIMMIIMILMGPEKHILKCQVNWSDRGFRKVRCQTMIRIRIIMMITITTIIMMIRMIMKILSIKF